MITRASDHDWLSLDLTMGQFKEMKTVAMFGPQPVGELETEELEGLMRGFRGLLRVADAEDASASPGAEAHLG